MTVLVAVLFGGDLETLEKKCDNDDFKSCGSLITIYTKPYKPYEYYHALMRAKTLLQRSCKKGNSNACKKVDQLNNLELPGSFLVDGVYAGMGKNKLLSKKFKKRQDGLYNVLQGEISDVMSSMMYDGKVSGKFLAYKTKILNEEAEVKIFLTKNSQVVYAVIIEWDKFPMGGGIKQGSAIRAALNQKYGDSKDIEKDKLAKVFMDGEYWQPNNDATISWLRGMSENMSIRTVVVYVDSHYYNKNTKESEKLDTTDKL